MGPTISLADIQASEEGIKALKLKQSDLMKGLEKQFRPMKGNTVAESERITTITLKDN